MKKKEPEVKTNTRFPTALHGRLAGLSTITSVSQNEIIVQAVKTICDMVDSEANWIVPPIVIQARALLFYLHDPKKIQAATRNVPALGVNESPPPYAAKKRP